MALAAKSRVVAHLDFRDCVAFNLEERRQKPVHSLEEFQIVNALALERTVGAAGVGDLFAAQLVPNPIRDMR